MVKRYDLIVVGAGSGGLVAAQTANTLGARVALVEKSDRLGGECLHAGCVPSKALIAAARAVQSARKAAAFGVHAEITVNTKKVNKHIQAAISKIEDEGENSKDYRAKGIDVYHGKAQFTGQRSLDVAGDKITATRIILATGSSPAIPPIDGLKDVSFDTNETIFNFTELPKRLAIIGGGPIGCELGQAFAQLGTQVTILQTNERLLPREDVKVSATLLKSMKADGVSNMLSIKVVKVSKSSDGIDIIVEQAGKQITLQVDRLLVATGRRANVDLQLEVAGIKTNDRGIVVDSKLQTSNKFVYAVGDCVGQYQFTHFAAEQAILATRNALYRFSGKQKEVEVPWVTFTTPEIARLGPTQAELSEKKIAFNVHSIDYQKIDKAIAEDEDGEITILTDTANKKILGACIVGAHAGEIMAPISLVYSQGRPYSDVANGMRAYPTYSIAIKQLVGQSQLEKLAKNSWLKLLRL